MRDFKARCCSKKISVIVCAYNEERDVVNCLESIYKSIGLSGRADDFEVFLVDNSSEDRTGEFASNFCHRHVGFQYVKIKHCSLSVSRNTALIKGRGEYVSYVDADGFVENSWATELLSIVNKGCMDIISGPVKEATLKSNNPLFDLHYHPPQIFLPNYLIGANMTFKKSILDKVGGFPSVFEVRGDESSLLVNLTRENPSLKRIYSKNVITYNHFCGDLKGFVKTHFQDGGRSYMLSAYSHSDSKHWTNNAYRLGSVLLMTIFCMTALVDIEYATYGLLGLLCLKVLREFKYYLYSFLGLRRGWSVKKVLVFLCLLFNPLVFDLGYAYAFFKTTKPDRDEIKVTNMPEVIN